MGENGLKVWITRKFKVTTDLNHDYPIAENNFERNFSAEQVNTCWVSDITYVWTNEGWLYLCIILGLFTQMAVGWSMRNHLRSELTVEALDMAVLQRKLSKGLIFHSDREFNMQQQNSMRN